MSPSTDPFPPLDKQGSAATNRMMKLPSMQGGSGADSYANNSVTQNFFFHNYCKPFVAEAVSQCALFDRPEPGHFRVADFGCSHGRNSIEYAEYIVELIRARRRLPPEIQYFFSDLPANDFNSLFQLLKPMNKEPGDHELHNFYAAGVPGSFYTRLFPAASLDFAICAGSVHWLSQVPLAVLDKTSPAWNGGHIWIHGDRPKVAEAYAQQFQRDMRRFLKCRAQELTNGAVLYLYAASRTEENPTGEYCKLEDTFNDTFASTWDEMVSAGVIDAEERDMFNVPQYPFHRTEFEAALKDVPELEVIKLVVKEMPIFPENEWKKMLNDPHKFAEMWVGFIKSVMKPMVEAHIGRERTNEFFERMLRIAALKGRVVTACNKDVLFTILRRQ